MIGRDDECARIEELLTGAGQARSAVLVVSGDPGIGKSCLLTHAESAAEARGIQVLSACGFESESILPFAALADLIGPLATRLGEIPKVQAAALSGALALGPPVESDRFTICAATLSLLAAAAEDRPLLASIDDAHWLDLSSLEALVFAGRRLSAEGIVLLLATRDEQAAMLEFAGFPVIRLFGLGVDDARALLERGVPVDEAVAKRLVDETRGNPLALLEAARILTTDQLAGRQALDERLPIGPGIERAFARQLDDLSAPARRALLVAAASDTGRLEPIIDALGNLDVPRSSLEEVESAGLVAVAEGFLAFRHPLIRSVAYGTATPADRRQAHGALAMYESPEQRAWHLAEAALGPDESVAQALEDVASAAAERSGYPAAAAAFERAAGLTAHDEVRTRRTVQAAVYFEVSGASGRAADLLEAALADTTEAFLRADIQQARARAEMRRGNFAIAAALLVAEAAAVEQLDQARAASLLCDAVIALAPTDRGSEALAIAVRAVELAQAAATEQRVWAEALLDHVQLLHGEVGDQGGIGLGDLVEQIGPSPHTAEPIALGCHVLVWLEQYERARALVDGAIERMRTVSAPGALPHLLAAKAQLEFRTGHWTEAYAAATESVQLGRETSVGDNPFALAYLARIEAAQGRERDARSHAQSAIEIATPMHLLAAVSYARAALALLELGLGQMEAAIDELEEIRRLLAQYGLEEPAVVQWEPDLVEAYVRMGRGAEADATLESLERRAHHTGRAWAVAVTHRCRGLLADESGFEEEFDDALEWHSRIEMPFERARTELVYGERLRRRRRRAKARELLRAALATFEALGARPWAERAQSELLASGEHARKRVPWTTDELTPQELQVALIVAHGASNREAAARLFLSPRTIDAHLGHVYRKLGIHSRSELVTGLTAMGAIVDIAPI